MQIEKAFEMVGQELTIASSEFGPFKSRHEGIAIIEEEFLELREAVFWVNHPAVIRDSQQEAIHLAAMAIRYLVDLC